MYAKCIIFHEFGRPLDVLTFELKKVEQPKEHEVIVRMVCSLKLHI